MSPKKDCEDFEQRPEIPRLQAKKRGSSLEQQFQQK
jgi:hypothetical protein